jgi:DNA-binding NtrC family response regulator
MEILFVGGFEEAIITAASGGRSHRILEDPHAAVAHIAAHGDMVNVVIMSLRMRAWNGLDAMEAVHRVDADLPVIISTHDIRVPAIVEAMQRGAYSYQFEENAAQELGFIVDRAWTYMEAVRANRQARAPPWPRPLSSRHWAFPSTWPGPTPSLPRMDACT